MGYDEHCGSSYESSSVASLNFVKRNEATLNHRTKRKSNPMRFRFHKTLERSSKDRGRKRRLAEETGTEAAEYSVKSDSEQKRLVWKLQNRRLPMPALRTTVDRTAQTNYAPVGGRWNHIQDLVGDGAALEEET